MSSYDGPKLQPRPQSTSERLADSSGRHFSRGENIRGTIKAAAAVTTHLGRVTKDCATFGAQAIGSGAKKVVTSPTTHKVVRETGKAVGQAAKELGSSVARDVMKPVDTVRKNW